MNLITKIHQVAWHRNGIEGKGFYAVLFDDKDNGRMVAVVYDNPHYCSVLKVSMLSEDNGVMFGKNSWRGDQYEPELREAIKTFDTGRVGDFSKIPPSAFREPLVN